MWKLFLPKKSDGHLPVSLPGCVKYPGSSDLLMMDEVMELATREEERIH
jgi:hypothetical protein